MVTTLTHTFPTNKNSEDEEHYLLFQNIISPILKVQRAMGFAVFHFDHAGKLSCDFDIWSTFYCTMIYSISASATLITQYKILKAVNVKGISFKTALGGYLKILAITPQLTGPIPFLLQKKKFLRFLQKWREFQEKYERITFNKLHFDGMLKLYKAAKYLMVIVALVPLLHLFCVDINIFEFIYVIAFILYFLHQLCISLYWLLTSKAIILSIQQYKEHFTQEVHSSRGYTSVIEEYRLLWLRLCKIVRNFAPSIGVTITICLAFHILYAVLALYRTTTTLPEYVRNADIYSIPFVLIDLCLVFSVILFYCNVGHNVPKQCSTNMLNTVLQIKEISFITGLDDARINIFLFMLSEYVPIVSVSGFYEINRSLFGAILSVLITYIIVIIQLQDSI